MSDAISQGLIGAPTQEEKDALREEYDEVVVATRANTNAGRLHIPDSGGGEAVPRCRDYKKHREAMWTVKSIKCYPEGHRDWCQYCVAVYREDNNE